MSQRDAHELFAIAARRLHWIAAALAAALALVMLAMYLLMRTWLHSEAAPVTRMPPVPRLQVAPSADLASEHARERAQLESYGWEDRQRGVARIPIERAMQLLAAPASATSSPGAQP
jgi:hypothetical protein